MTAFDYRLFTSAADNRAMRLSAVIAFAAFAAPATAAPLVVEVRTPAGAPVPNAVVSLYPAGRPVPVAAPRGPLRIAQRNTRFDPFVLVVPLGAEVAFPNYDAFRHHVYSFSPVRRFELKLYAKEQSRTVRFDKPGAVPLGCNIHDGMTAFVKVSDTALAVATDARGQATFANVPAGAVVARIWHPYLRAPANQLEARWSVPNAGRAAHSVTVSLRPPPPTSSSY